MTDKKLKKLYPLAYAHFKEHPPKITWEVKLFSTYEMYFDGEMIGGYKRDDIREHIYPKVEKILNGKIHLKRVKKS